MTAPPHIRESQIVVKKLSGRSQVHKLSTGEADLRRLPKISLTPTSCSKARKSNALIADTQGLPRTSRGGSAHCIGSGGQNDRKVVSFPSLRLPAAPTGCQALAAREPQSVWCSSSPSPYTALLGFLLCSRVLGPSASTCTSTRDGCGRYGGAPHRIRRPLDAQLGRIRTPLAQSWPPARTGSQRRSSRHPRWLWRGCATDAGGR